MDWKSAEIRVEIDLDATEDEYVTATFITPAGRVKAMAAVRVSGQRAVIEGLHIHGLEAGAGSIGIAGLRALVTTAMEILDVVEVEIAGARRTSGAGPGRVPRHLRFTRAGPHPPG